MKSMSESDSEERVALIDASSESEPMRIRSWMCGRGD